MGIGAKHVMVILSALLIGYLPILYFGVLLIIDQSERVETASVILAFSLAFLNVIVNPHIYGEKREGIPLTRFISLNDTNDANSFRTE